jgi:hypothetical protein
MWILPRIESVHDRGKHYVGQTGDLRSRLSDHNSEWVRVRAEAGTGAGFLYIIPVLTASGSAFAPVPGTTNHKAPFVRSRRSVKQGSTPTFTKARR